MTYTSTQKQKDTYKRFKSVILMVLLVSFCFLPVFNVKAVHLSGWSNKIPLTIDNTANSNELIDFEVDIEVEFRGGMNNDFSDIRFTDSDEITLLYFGWDIDDEGIEKKENEVSAQAIVKIPVIPANSTKTIYMYYGNPSAYSVANLETALTWFDHFTRDRSLEYEYIRTIWDIANSKIRGTGGDWGYIIPKNLSIKNLIIRARVRALSSGSTYTLIRYQDASNWWGGLWRPLSGENTWYGRMINGSLYKQIIGFPTEQYVWSAWNIEVYETEHKGNVKYLDTDVMSWNFVDSNINEVGQIKFQFWSSYESWVDFFQVRKNTKPFPIVTVPPPPAQLDFAPTITSPTEAQEIFGNTVTVQGECWYAGVDIIDKDTDERFLENCHYPIKSCCANYYFQDPIILDYSTSTGRVAGYVEFTTPESYFAGLIRQDKNDVKIFKYNNDLGIFYDELDYWFGTVGTDTVFKFYAVDEPAGRTKPIFDYYLLYGFAFEDIPPTIIPDEPVTTHIATRDETQLIKGNYHIEFERDFGEHTITAQSMIEHPYIIYSAESNPVNFTLLETLLPPPYSWIEPILWYNEVSKFEQPTLFLSVIFDISEGTLKPLMAQINKFTEFFNKEQAQQDALNITGAMKTVISYTRLFDNFFGSLPISWALILLIIVYIAKFVIIYTAKAIQTFKPL